MKKYLKYLLILAVAAIAVAYYMYNKPHKNMNRAKADIEQDAKALFAAYQQDETKANGEYLDKVIQVTGTIKDTHTDEEGAVNITLDTGDDMSGVVCQMDNLTEHKRLDFKPGEEVTMKGMCTGMLMDVVLVRCVEVK